MNKDIPEAAGHQSPLSAWFLVGPTAVGKTAIAETLAAEGGWELISADAMQVYRGMNVGTAKPAARSRMRFRYHGLDLVSPRETFSVWAFRQAALEALRGAATRCCEAMVVGGSGLYVGALTRGMDALPPPAPGSREHWRGVWRAEGLAGLQRALRLRSPQLFAGVKDKRNARRLIRALELADAGVCEPPVRPPEAVRAAGRLAGLYMASDALSGRIERRVNEMFENGLVEETGALVSGEGALSETARKAIGYAEALAVWEGRLTREEAVRQTVRRTRQLARRQLTWFRRQAQVEWIDVRDGEPCAEVAERVRNVWRRNGPTFVPA